ncbi:hypothetical protein NIIDMKKI_02790 [Mycobacterium kansasii]|uniref:non-specific serine/threonine protein kinase n=1 Tax=Mycobacterium kansasii TaxID=1768 RepID=A0A7G1I460_MYCKA|nr:hypothetical protein NIIDMKKI_02790 [Mycobacterium kansasii]
MKLCGALETAHRAGTLHRDIKPANVLVNDYGEPQLTDFGIAHIEGGFETAVGFFSGTIDYTAPEVMTGNPATVVADVYSLGATLYALIAGSAAHERKKGEDLVAQYLRISSTGVPDLRPDGIPDAVCSAIEKAMSIDPAERPVSAAELGRELQAAQRRNGLKPASMAITNMRARTTDASTDVPETPPVSPAILSPEAQVPLRTSSTVPLKGPQPAARAGGAAALQPPSAAGQRPSSLLPSQSVDHRRSPGTDTAFEPGHLGDTQAQLRASSSRAESPRQPAAWTGATPPIEPPKGPGQEGPAGPAAPDRPGVGSPRGRVASWFAEPDRKRNRILLTAAAAVAVVLLVAGGVFLVASHDNGAHQTVSGQPGTQAPVQWKPITNARVARDAAATTQVDGTIWIFGGVRADGTVTGLHEGYDPVIDSWKGGDDLPVPVQHAMAVTWQGNPIVLGGWRTEGSKRLLPTKFGEWSIAAGWSCRICCSPGGRGRGRGGRPHRRHRRGGRQRRTAEHDRGLRRQLLDPWRSDTDAAADAGRGLGRKAGVRRGRKRREVRPGDGRGIRSGRENLDAAARAGATTQ